MIKRIHRSRPDRGRMFNRIPNLDHHRRFGKQGAVLLLFLDDHAKPE